MLTRKQHELICFINDRLDETGVSPSFEEMKEALDLKSKSGVHRLISALEERDFIRRLPNRARALEVLQACPSAAEQDAPPRKPPTLKPAPPRRAPQPANDVIEIPLHGRIAAGVPIEAFEGSAMLAGPRRPARQRRTLCARSVGRFDGRGRHPRRRLCADPPHRDRARRRDRRRADRGQRGDAQIFPPRRRDGPARSGQPRLRSAALRARSRSACRASSPGCCAATTEPSAPSAMLARPGLSPIGCARSPATACTVAGDRVAPVRPTA